MVTAQSRSGGGGGKCLNASTSDLYPARSERADFDLLLVLVGGRGQVERLGAET